MDDAKNITISRKAFFSSGFKNPQSENGAGSNFSIEIFVSGRPSPESGLLVNLTEIDLSMKEILTNYDMKHLNFENPDLQDLLEFPLARIANSLVKRFLPLQKTLNETTESRLTELVLSDLGTQESITLPLC